MVGKVSNGGSATWPVHRVDGYPAWGPTRQNANPGAVETYLSGTATAGFDII